MFCSFLNPVAYDISSEIYWNTNIEDIMNNTYLFFSLESRTAQEIKSNLVHRLYKGIFSELNSFSQNKTVSHSCLSRTKS
jgi:hypothetical protein